MTIKAFIVKSILLAGMVKGVFLQCETVGGDHVIRTWLQWSPCNVTCGGGYRTRVLRCDHYRYQSWWHIRNLYRTDYQTTYQTCNQNCIHGLFQSDSCICPPGYKGKCCEVAPVCHAPCLNGGSCVGEDMCTCPDGFYGRRCEIGNDDLAEGLKPRFNPALDPDVTNKDKSWYDETPESLFNRVCSIKVATQNAPGDAIVTAVSYKDGDSQIHYGNFSTGPVDSQGDVTGHSRFACLKVRCPGWKIDGTSFNVNVDVTIQSTSGRCNVTYDQIAAPLTSSTNRMSLTLVEGDNYGPKFGIYYASGYRQQAESLSEHVCYSGRQYDFGRLNPSVGVVATLKC